MTHEDIQANSQLAENLVDHEPREVSALVGLHALATLAHMMPPDEFSQFIQDAKAQFVKAGKIK